MQNLCLTCIGHLSSTDGQLLSFAVPTQISDAFNLSTLIPCLKSFAADILLSTFIDSALFWPLKT